MARPLLSIGVCLTALSGCTIHEGLSPDGRAPRVLESHVTGELAHILGSDGRLNLPPPPPGVYPEISAVRAAELAHAFSVTFGVLLKEWWDEDRGATIAVHRLRVCGRQIYARSSYQPVPPDRTLWARKVVGNWWLVTLCDGTSAEVLVAVSVHNTDVGIDERGWVVQPPREAGTS